MKLWQKLLVATLAVWGGIAFFGSDTTKGWSLVAFAGGGLFSMVIAVVCAMHWGIARTTTQKEKP